MNKALTEIISDVQYAFTQLSEGFKVNNLPQGSITDVEKAIANVKNIRSLATKPPTIGFFGATSRGKSSLLNQLIGEDLLPTHPLPTTSTAIRIVHDKSCENYELIVKRKNGSLEIEKYPTCQDTTKALERYASHLPDIDESEVIEDVEVRHDFSHIDVLINGGILIDTPGAECLFETSEEQNEEKPCEETQNNNSTYSQDAKRALEILDLAQIAVFVLKASDKGSNRDKALYEKHITKKEHYTIINYKDAVKPNPMDNETCVVLNEDKTINEFETQKNIIAKFAKFIGIESNRAICVSCYEAKKAKRENGTVDNVLLEKSNIPKFKAQITSLLNEYYDQTTKLCDCIENLGKKLNFLASKEEEKMDAGDEAIAYRDIIKKAIRARWDIALTNAKKIDENRLIQVMENFKAVYAK